MNWDRLTRRHLLKGLGASLILPALPSLLTPSQARAQAAATQKTFIGILGFYGLFKMLGPESILMPRTAFDLSTYLTQGYTPLAAAPRHSAHVQPLSAIAAANGGKISDLVDAEFTPYLSKMLML